MKGKDFEGDTAGLHKDRAGRGKPTVVFSLEQDSFREAWQGDA